jgi:hypothetical protein
MKMAVFWVVAPCNPVKVFQCFRGACCLIALMMEAARTSKTLANFYLTTRCYNPEGRQLRHKTEFWQILNGLPYTTASKLQLSIHHELHSLLYMNTLHTVLE